MLAELKKTTELKMSKSIEAFKGDLSRVRTGRAHTGLLDHVSVDYYGTPTLLAQVAKVILLDARTIGVSPFEKKMIPAVEKAIRESDLGLNPATAGDTIRVPMPSLTEERRKELAKLAGQYAEKARIAVRNVRRDGMDHLKVDEKKHEISEDERKRLEVEVQKLTDDTIKEIDSAAHAKEQEILGQ